MVRYAALLALVCWLGALMRGAIAIPASAYLTPLVCGGALLLLLVVLKFMGPPPRSFLPRIGIVAVMLGFAVYDRYATSAVAPAVQLALGCVLLGWYAAEP